MNIRLVVNGNDLTAFSLYGFLDRIFEAIAEGKTKPACWNKRLLVLEGFRCSTVEH